MVLEHKMLNMSYYQLVENAKDIYANDKFIRIVEHKWLDKYSYLLVYKIFDYKSVVEIRFQGGTNDVTVVPLTTNDWVFDITKRLQEYFSLLGFNNKRWV